jgi:hypothetical protein
MNKFSSNVHTYDPHFNLFYSYSIGGKKKTNKDDETEDTFRGKDKEKRMEILEDNLTRAFLITIGSLTPQQIKNYFNILFSKEEIKIKSTKEIHLDLQNYSKDNQKLSEIIQDENSKKILLVISDVVSNVTEGELLSSLRKVGKDKTRGSRPDGWVFFNDTIILIESKVRDNLIMKDQLIRHIINQFGKNKEWHKNFHFVSKKWEDLITTFEFLGLKKNNISNILKDNFKEVLMSTGQNLDLTFITEGEGYDKEKAKKQFPLLLNAFNKELKENQIDSYLSPSRKVKAGYLWESYNTSKNDKLIKDPHYSFYFDKDFAGIALTVSNYKKAKFKKLLESNELVNFIMKLFNEYKDQKRVLLSRYSINMSNYRKVDYKRGQMHGEEHDTFKLEIELHEVVRNNKDKYIKDYLKSMIDFVDLVKQVDFKFMLRYPNVSKIDNNRLTIQLREENKKLFENPKLLMDTFISFIKDTKDIFNCLINESK